MPVSSEADPQIARWDRSFFGHPRGLSTLFFTEMWERFSFYGMRTILLFYMTRAASAGGLGFPDSKAGAIYGIYMSLVYLVTVPGGWIADRILGQRRSVLWGGVIIALGHYSMAIPSLRHLLRGPGAHHLRHGPAETKRQHPRLAASTANMTRAATPAFRSSTWASTSAR